MFAADKVAKARELRTAAAGDRAPAREMACKHAPSLELLDRRLHDHPCTAELRFELEAQALTPGLAWLGESPRRRRTPVSRAGRPARR